jgi:hypothetical protein
VKTFCLILLAATAALAAPAFARAGNVAMRVERVQAGTRAEASAASMRFNMLALQWRGRGAVAVRVHRLHGGWGPWAGADDDVQWTGASDRYQVRAGQTVHDVRAFLLWSRVTTGARRTLSEASSPPIVTRSGWDANEEIVRAKPRYAPAVKLALVHHTVSNNTYSRAQAAAIVRGIEVYHVKGNGWDDIGYNFLVDRFGTVYEGRAGGVDRNVIGAHAEGFNTGTFGVSLIGNFQAATPTPAMRAALVGLLAWRLDVAHADPLSTVVFTSGGNAKFRTGKLVTLRAVSGHRDTGPTECPGGGAYALLPGIAKRAAATGLPKLYSPVVAGSLGGPIRFQARLSSALPWIVTVADRTGKAVAHGSGTSALVEWTWTSPAAKRSYTWTIAAPGIRIASGTLGTAKPLLPLALTLTAVSATPVVAPAADGTTPPAQLAFTLGAPARVEADVVGAGGVTALTILEADRPKGPTALAWDPSTLAAGTYTVLVIATAGSKTVSRSVPLLVVRVVGGYSVTPAVFTPNADGSNDTATFWFTLFASAHVVLTVGTATVFSGDLPVGPASIVWDGAGVPPGSYTATLTVGDAALTAPLTIQ